MKNKKELKKINLKKIKEQQNSFFKEFKQFIARGNVMDLAVGVIIGNAFSKIVTSLTNNILMPLVGVVIGGFDFSNLSYTFNISLALLITVSGSPANLATLIP